MTLEVFVVVVFGSLSGAFFGSLFGIYLGARAAAGALRDAAERTARTVRR